MLLRLPDRHAGIRNTATPTQPTQPTQGISPHKTIWGDALMMPESSQTPNELPLHKPPPPPPAEQRAICTEATHDFKMSLSRRCMANTLTL